MKARWKRNAVVATMAVLVCAAVALNWRYTSDQAVSQMEQAQSEETGTKILGQATLVSGVEDGADDAGETDGAADGGEAVDETAVYTGSDYFASARLTRQQARDSATSLLQEAAEQENADAAVANEASEGIQVLAAYTLQEAQIENLVTAKGYQDCVAFLGEDGVSVVVATDTGELTAEDVAKITGYCHVGDRIARWQRQDHGGKLAVVILGRTWYNITYEFVLTKDSMSKGDIRYG